MNRCSSTRSGWAVWHRNSLIEVPDEIILQIRSIPTQEFGWCKAEMGQAWRNIFPLTMKSRKSRMLLLDHPAWGQTPNPWW